MNKQCTSTVLMIRPDHFGYNEDTAADNAFQQSPDDVDESRIAAMALKEFDGMVDLLRAAGVEVLVIEDTEKPLKPDALFPNNWITTHANSAIVTYPMMATVRRAERREDIIELLMARYGFERRYSFEQYEAKKQFLEGTGSMVLDRENRFVYACISERTDPLILDKFCALTGYERLVFDAVDEQDLPIYHTNVMMSIAAGFAVVCMESIKAENIRMELTRILQSHGKILVPISMRQMYAFAGNILQLMSRAGDPLIAISQTAYESLEPSQVATLRSFGELIICPIPTIEAYGGGSVRCMLAEIFKPDQSIQ